MNHTLKNIGIATLLVGTIACGSKDNRESYRPSESTRLEIAAENAVASKLGLVSYARGILTGTVVDESYNNASDSYALIVDTDEGRYTMSITRCTHEAFPGPDALNLALQKNSQVNFATEHANAYNSTYGYFNELHMGTINTCLVAPAKSD